MADAPFAAVQIRQLDAGDSVGELTALLHRSYKRLLDMGLKYLATWQSEDITKQRVDKGTCFVAVVDGRIAGTITYYRSDPWAGIKWLDLPHVAVVGQFAVEPELQCSGIGSALLARAEEVAATDGATEVALTTAELAAHLIAYYKNRGYRVVEWSDATQPDYRSVVMSKTLRT